MTEYDWIVCLACLIVVCLACYMMGRIDGKKSQDRDLELEKYRIDKFFEHKRWQEEGTHAPITAYDPLDEGADWSGDHEE